MSQRSVTGLIPWKGKYVRTKARFFYLIVFIFFLQTVLASSGWAATRIMPLGDSITQGYASGELDPDRQISYRKALWDKLVAAGYDVNFVGSLNSGSDLFDDGNHEGHPGWTDDEIVNGNGVPAEGKLNEWLALYQPHVVLLHIGTNGLDPSPDDVADILDVIDNYSLDTYVILARIINQSTDNAIVTQFNDNVEDMAYLRVYTTNPPAYPDNIIFGADVDMEDGAGIDYRLRPSGGDMENNLHPYQISGTAIAPGYEKMANVWFSALQEILPMADAGSDQSVDEGKSVTLDGSRSINPEFNPILSYYWQQTEGKPVTLSPDQTVVKPTFTAPSAGSGGEKLSFRLMVTYSDGTLSSDNTGVNVNGHSSSSSSGCFIGTAAYGLLIPYGTKFK